MQQDMTSPFSRMTPLFEENQLERIRKAHVMVFGLGGVGSYAVEALCRCGVGKLTLVDNDSFVASNLNRQLPALHSTLGRKKVEVVAERCKDIAPECELIAIEAFYLPDTPVPIADDCTLVVDAIDTISAKLHSAQVCQEKNIPLISCMGMGNRLDPTKITFGDICETSTCPLCRVMRRELRKRNVPSLRVVYSQEIAKKPNHVE